MSGICQGLTVLEYGAGSIPASMIGMMLADNGARVVKIEPPEGDRLRVSAPSGFLVWNRGKESRLLDLRTPAGRSEARELAQHVDVIVEGFGAGVVEAWGLGFDELSALNPALVYCSVKGFGRQGAYAKLKAYDGIVMAKCGLFARGDWGFRPGPIFSGVGLASHGAAQIGVSATLAALMVRENTGRGQRVEATMVQGVSATDFFGTMHWQYAKRTGGKPHVVLAPTGVLAATRYLLTSVTRDGRYIITMPMLAHQARALTRALGLGHLIDDPRYTTMSMFPTPEDAQAWEDMIAEAFRGRTLEEWLPVLEADTDIPFEIVRTTEEGLDHPQIVHLGQSLTVHDPVHGPVRQVGPVASFGRAPSVIGRSAPAIGESRGDLTGPLRISATGPSPEHPLAGVTIVEFGYFFAMPFGLSLAAMLGARVIKIEDGGGDPMRVSFGAKESGAIRTMEGKESLSVDVTTPEGRKIVHDLIAKADAFVTSFRPDVPGRLGLDHETLAKINPRLVYLYAGGYGIDGPYAMRPMYAQTAGAPAGNVHRQAAHWLDPELVEDWNIAEIQAVIIPRLRGIVDGDSNAAVMVLSALMFALAHQRRTGEGQFVSTSMLTGNSYAYSDDFNSYEGKPPFPEADPDQFGFNALYRIYQARSGWVFLAVPTQAEWQIFATALGRDELVADPRFATPKDRAGNDDALVDELSVAFKERDAHEWETFLASRDVACVRVFEDGQSAFTCTDEVLRETDLVVEVEHKVFGRILRHGLPAQFSETPGRIAPSCLRGEHNTAVLGELGYAPERIAELVAGKIVFPPDPLPAPTATD
ncbi:CoA transferase [Frankia sp. Cppng1_Ct_nod]|uniref:CaiB/BaiF CoA transferase family protein n=1 Tax=Frankia sp. Cppng1_Ct_nod TaxID=2897162 RepID=UPI001041970D|nr:CoA transferase [Frankia sp. Cppng1_Ct_nod]